MTNRHHIAGFSLVEVTLALGIFVFAGVALVSLLSVALRSNRDSKEQLQAANIAEFICSTRRAAPTTDISTSQPNFPLPPLYPSQNPATPTYLTWDGLKTTSTTDARFGLIYNIMSPASYTAKTNPGFATVYLCIYWPAQAPVTAASGHFELTTTFALP